MKQKNDTRENSFSQMSVLVFMNGLENLARVYKAKKILDILRFKI